MNATQGFYAVFLCCVLHCHTPLTSLPYVFLLLLLLLWLLNFSKVVTFLTVLKAFSKFWTTVEPACSHLLGTFI